MELNLKTYPIQILTRDYIVIGEFTPRGRPNIFINDAQNDTFTITSAEVTALAPGSTFSTLKTKEIYLPKEQIQIMVLGDFTVEDAQLLPKAETLALFTDTYIVRGKFYMSQESSGRDLLGTRGPFYGSTDAEIISTRPLAEEVGGEAPIIYVNGLHIQTFYSEAVE